MIWYWISRTPSTNVYTNYSAYITSTINWRHFAIINTIGLITYTGIFPIYLYANHNMWLSRLPVASSARLLSSETASVTRQWVQCNYCVQSLNKRCSWGAQRSKTRCFLCYCWVRFLMSITVHAYPLRRRHISVRASQITDSMTVCSTVCACETTMVTSKFSITGPLWENPPVIGRFPSHWTSNAESVPMSWRHNVLEISLFSSYLLASHALCALTLFPRRLGLIRSTQMDYPINKLISERNCSAPQGYGADLIVQGGRSKSVDLRCKAKYFMVPKSPDHINRHMLFCHCQYNQTE